MSSARILIVDDEKGVRDLLKRLLLKKDYRVQTASTGKEAYSLMDNYTYELALFDLKLPDSDGLTLLKHLKSIQPFCAAVIITAYSTIRSAVEAIHLGAFDYLDKPLDDMEVFYDVISKALRSQHQDDPVNTDEEVSTTGFLVGKTQKMRQIKQMADVLAPKDITIMIQGETGTGKEVLSRYIHSVSKRANEPFIAVNCGAFTESLLESELFGHEKGSFTGALNKRQGIFEIADRGTLFLDEISEASLNVQVKLLRVLETGEFYRVGGKESIQSNIRIIAATNTNIEEAVSNGKFRNDLLYRLDVARLVLPPLRERSEDIPQLVNFFIEKNSSNESSLCLSADAMHLLFSYKWPGNIRELSNMVAHSLAMAKGGIVKPFHLPEKIIKSLKSQEEGVAHEQIDTSTDLVNIRTDHSEIINAFIENLTGYLVKEYNNAGIIDLPAILDDLKASQGLIAQKIIKVVMAETLGDRQSTANKLNLNTRSLRYLLKEKPLKK